MRAFLSHSSKDKSLVREIADKLGASRCEYDEYSFEYILNSQAIRRAFSRSDLYVLFLSEHSTSSSFVAEEIRTALDFRGQGSLKKVIIFPLDDTSYKALPDWLRATNVVIRLKSVLTITRKIEAELFGLETEISSSKRITIPRDEEERALFEALSLPPGKAPVAIHIVGYVGIGRKTLLRKTLSAVFPRQIQTYIPVSMEKFEGVNEFYRRLYGLFVISSIEEQIEAFERFAECTEDAQVETLADMLTQITMSEEFVIIEDYGSVYNDEGDYQPFFLKLVETLKGANRPILGFIQTRMMPLKLRHDRSASFHLFLNPMSDSKISQLASFSLRDAEIDFSEDQIKALSHLLDGNPINVKLAMNAIKSYGLPSFLADPSLLVEWKRRRAEDFLSQITFSDTENSVMAILYEYRFMNFETINGLLSVDIELLVSALRKLEEYCCIQRRGGLYAISAPIHDAIGRDKQFFKSSRWRKDIALKLVELVSEYREEDRAPVALMEAAALATIISGKNQTLAARYILPSYYLTLAQRAYNEDRRQEAMDLCKQAWERNNYLSVEGKVETLRLWGLSAARIKNEEGLTFALSALDAFRAKKIARRHAFFLRGFSKRLRRQFDAAEKEFLSAHELAPDNMSINRELANLYRQQRNFVEGEGYARSIHKIAPTNPYIIDVLLECLLGKAAENLSVNQSEIDELLRDLSKYGDVPGSSFYQTRLAHDLFRKKDRRAALIAASKAVDRTPEFLPCRYLRADIYIALSNPSDARKDLEAINKILEKRGGFSADDEGKAVELDVRILTEERNFKQAREKLNNSQFLPRKVAQRLAQRLAKAINLAPDKADKLSVEWARKVVA